MNKQYTWFGKCVLGMLCILNYTIQSFDENIWSSQSSPSIDKKRVSAFNSILIEHDYYFKILKIKQDPRYKKQMKKIKKHCKVKKMIRCYKTRGISSSPVYGDMVYNCKSLRKKKCYCAMKQLYEWLHAMEGTETTTSSVAGSEADMAQEEASS